MCDDDYVIHVPTRWWHIPLMFGSGVCLALVLSSMVYLLMWK